MKPAAASSQHRINDGKVDLVEQLERSQQVQDCPGRQAEQGEHHDAPFGAMNSSGSVVSGLALGFISSTGAIEVMAGSQREPAYLQHLDPRGRSLECASLPILTGREFGGHVSTCASVPRSMAPL